MTEAERQAVLWRHWVDDFDDVYASLDPVDAAEFLVGIAGAGPVLELGVGTGRVAIEVARRGPTVVGVDIVPEMLRELEAKRGDLPVETVHADMTTVRLDRRFTLVYLVDSSLFHVTEQDSQVECLRNAARHLVDGGAIVVESIVPWADLLRERRQLYLANMSDDRVDVTAITTDTAVQTMMFQEVTLRRDGTRLLPVFERYCWPSELDLMARLAGMRQEIRYENFARAAYTRRSRNQVSVYRHPGRVSGADELAAGRTDALP